MNQASAGLRSDIVGGEDRRPRGRVANVEEVAVLGADKLVALQCELSSKYADIPERRSITSSLPMRSCNDSKSSSAATSNRFDSSNTTAYTISLCTDTPYMSAASEL